MNKKEFYFSSKDGIHQIHTICWQPESSVIGVLQLVHGMIEYIDRYDIWARYMTAQGFLVIGHDHLGHGQSVNGPEEFGYFPKADGNECLIGDIHRIRVATQKRYPNVPYFIMGHSMGSFLTRQYLMMHGEGLAGAIIMGTGSQPGIVLSAGKIVCKLIACIKGWRHRSKLMEAMAFSSYNKKIKSKRTPKDWLSVNEENVDNYIADPFCSFSFTMAGYYQMFRGIQYIQKCKHIRQIPKDLPLFFVAGACDPVGHYGKDVEHVADSYVKAGVKDVMVTLYDQARHELLNEHNRDQVTEDMWNWIQMHM